MLGSTTLYIGVGTFFKITKVIGIHRISFHKSICSCKARNNLKMSPIITSPSKTIKNTPVLSVSTEKPQKSLMKISVDGNISSGKSTLVNALNDVFPKDFNFEVEIVPEPLEKWTNMQGHNLLEMLYKDVAKNNFMFQHYVQLTRLMDTIKDRTNSDLQVTEGFSGKIRIMERSLQNNRYCFSELARRQGTLQEAEFAVLAEWYKWLEEHVDLNLDLIIYLRTSPQVVFDRMKSRGRSEEASVPLKYRSDLHDTYEDWLVRGTIVEETSGDLMQNDNPNRQKVIIIDADKSQTEVAQQCRQLIQDFLTKRFSRNNSNMTNNK